MKQRIHKIMSSVMVFVVLLSTMSFTTNIHYCGKTLVETALFQNAKGCGMEMSNPLKEGCTITKKNSCSNVQLRIDGQDELQLKLSKFHFNSRYL